MSDYMLGLVYVYSRLGDLPLASRLAMTDRYVADCGRFLRRKVRA